MNRNPISALLITVSVLLFACSSDDAASFENEQLERLAEHPNLIVTAPPELIGATLLINEADRRVLWPDTLIDHAYKSFWRRMFASRGKQPTAAKAYLELFPGEYVLSITQKGFRPITKRVQLSHEIQHARIERADLAATPADSVVP